MFLSEELLQEIHERAPRYDKENVWPAEDYAALKEAGYKRVRRFRFVAERDCARTNASCDGGSRDCAWGEHAPNYCRPWQAHGSFWQQEGRTNPS